MAIGAAQIIGQAATCQLTQSLFAVNSQVMANRSDDFLLNGQFFISLSDTFNLNAQFAYNISGDFALNAALAKSVLSSFALNAYLKKLVGTMSNVRLLTISIVAFLRNVLDDNGFSGVTIVDAFPEDDLLVHPDLATGRAGEVRLPAIALSELANAEAYAMGIGESGTHFPVTFSIFIHGLTKGQEIDIRTVIKEALEDERPNFYNYNYTGYPDVDSAAPVISTVEFSRISSRPVSLPDVKPILKHGGAVSFVATSVRTRS